MFESVTEFPQRNKNCCAIKCVSSPFETVSPTCIKRNKKSTLNLISFKAMFEIQIAGLIMNFHQESAKKNAFGNIEKDVRPTR